MQRQTITKRMSIRAVALLHGMPARTVARAVDSGALPAVRTVTETGRERVYISPEDAQQWVDGLVVIASKLTA
jgi:hypothetical protein